ncbi:hypothetical protein L2E82_14862 [Cichorium intybus]|uniref:Uncharacterized protein n=1 Tax=Cichorium intybus TaxID=13427 RepID=A0ACB9F1L9_CICIN|nr:hypothetical protein L2E82_14862 [Cichorium intybus]
MMETPAIRYVAPSDPATIRYAEPSDPATDMTKLQGSPPPGSNLNGQDGKVLKRNQTERFEYDFGKLLPSLNRSIEAPNQAEDGNSNLLSLISISTSECSCPETNLISLAPWEDDLTMKIMVAMSVNYIVTSGAKPLFFLDYYATSQLDVDLAEKVMKGFVDGCQQSDCSFGWRGYGGLCGRRWGLQ